MGVVKKIIIFYEKILLFLWSVLIIIAQFKISKWKLHDEVEDDIWRERLLYFLGLKER